MPDVAERRIKTNLIYYNEYPDDSIGTARFKVFHYGTAGVYQRIIFGIPDYPFQ